mmetsp:Transcript_111935/g.321592  ORF Transcript_111935/g.321592 Transcript_111935/m.321592 type:complete len:619 (-) Transcript_111935:52-1908(-)
MSQPMIGFRGRGRECRRVPLLRLWCAALGARAASEGLQPQCQAYLESKNLGSPSDLAQRMEQVDSFGGRCTPSPDTDTTYAPNPTSTIPGVTDTTPLACRYGNPEMFKCQTCCGWRPHFNWVVSTCEPNDKLSSSMFCKVPQCVEEGSPKINYVAAYQYNGSHFVLLDESTAGDLASEGVSGNWHDKTGWEAKKQQFEWMGGVGDWTSKYAPWGDGPSGPRGVTPPGALWILSAENFYYAGFYMLSQLNLNVQGKGNPTGSPCWVWEFDPVEGTVGWMPENAPLPGNLNQLYATNNAAPSGCMPVAYTAMQANGLKRDFSTPASFATFCQENPQAIGCEFWEPSQADLWWSGTVQGSQRFENYWDEAYVFAVVLDQRGLWIYRWRPDAATGETGWPGVSRHQAARVLAAKPRPVTDASGLSTDVPGDVSEAVIFQPSLPPEEACRAASIQATNWQFGANALGAMATQLNAYGPGQEFDGAQNWWAHFADSGQQAANYPLSIAGVPKQDLPQQYTCNKPNEFSCQCRQDGAQPQTPPTGLDKADSNRQPGAADGPPATAPKLLRAFPAEEGQDKGGTAAASSLPIVATVVMVCALVAAGVTGFFVRRCLMSSERQSLWS